MNGTVEAIRCRETPRTFSGNVNVSCNTDFTTVLWNKYKLIVYNDVNEIFESRIHDYEGLINSKFAIEKVLIYESCLLCLDCSGNLNINTITPSYDSVLSSTFTILHPNTIACDLINNNDVISLKRDENISEFLINEFNREFSLKYSFRFNNPDYEWRNAPRGKSILVCKQIRSGKLNKLIRDTYGVTENIQYHNLIIICLDKINVYGCIIPESFQKLSNLRVIKIYKSHSEIVDIKICTRDEICILVGLSSGNILKLPFIRVTQAPKVVPLNIALHKFEINEDAIIYTDGLTMWKTKQIYSNDLITEQFFVTNVRDFCVVNSKIICTTFSNLIYLFNIFDPKCYYTKEIDRSEVKVFTNTDYLEQITSEIQKNETLIKDINKESEYLIALSLSKRRDIIDNLIHVTFNVFDNYNDLVQEIDGLTLTEEANAYCDAQLYYFVIELLVNTIQHKLNKLLSDVLGDIKIHITLFANKVLKTTSIKITEKLKKKAFVIPLKKSLIKKMTKLQAIVEIVTNIPAKMDERQKQWVVLYHKVMDINAEYFMKINNFTNNICLKEDNMSLETLIYKRGEHLHGTRYNFHVSSTQQHNLTLYVKLPSDFLQILSTNKYYAEIDYLDSRKKDLLKQTIRKLSTSNQIEFDIRDEKVILDVIEKKIMSVFCADIYIAFDIRNCLSRIFLTALKDKSGQEIVDRSLYDNIKNLKQDIITKQALERLTRRFYKIIFHSLPL